MDDFDAVRTPWMLDLPQGRPEEVGLARIVDADAGRDEAENEYHEAAATRTMFAWRPHGRVDPAVGAVTVDVIQFLTGDAAARAAGEDVEVPPPNDYYIRNTSSRLRILRVASGARSPSTCTERRSPAAPPRTSPRPSLNSPVSMASRTAPSGSPSRTAE